MTAAGFDEARLLAAQGSLSAALDAVEGILLEEPGHLPALLLKGSLLLELRREEAARAAYEAAVAAAPRSSEALNGLARCLHALGRNDEALLAGERARGLLGEGDNFRFAAPVYLTLLWCLRDMRRFKEALAIADEGLARCPDAVLAQWASQVEEELSEAEQEEC
jgi:tetratricopeptide (TPR) repeat protein